VPLAHETQTVADAAEYCPATHVPDTAQSPPVAQILPAGQAVTTVSPVVAQYEPATQLMQEP